MNTKRIFIVDDEIPILNLFKKSFEKKGYVIDTAETAAKALEVLKTEQFQVLFLDLLLPDMDGLDLCREIRKSGNNALLFAITGYADQYELMDCLNAGFDGYFLKPIDMEVLYKVVEEALNE